MTMFSSFQLLELNIISAQELAPACRKMKTYAVAWVHSERKLTTRIDYNGGENPTWNDKFVFRVNEEFLYADTSAVVIEIYALHWFRDIHVGTVRVLISNLIPPNRRPGYRTSNNEYHRTPPQGMRFVALQVRRSSGRPQGILNIGVGLLDGSMRSMPLYTHMDSSAVGYRDLLGEEDHHLQHLRLNSNKGSSKNPQSPSSKQNQSDVSKPKLRRSKSDTSSLVVSDLLSRVERCRLANRQPVSALVSNESESESEIEHITTDSDEHDTAIKTPQVPIERYDSIEADVIDPLPREETREDVPKYDTYHHQSRKTPRNKKKKEKQRPSNDYDRARASPYLPRHEIVSTPIRGNRIRSTPMRSNNVAMSPMRSNIVSSTPIRGNGIGSTPMRSNNVAMSPMRSNIVSSTPMRSNKVAMSPMRSNMVNSTPIRANGIKSTPMRSNIVAMSPMRSNIVNSTPMRSNYMATPMRSNLVGRGRLLTESELGPSPSEVAEKLARDKHHNNDTESSILSEWSIDETTIEGLRSKLDRWRMELPPLYDIGSSNVSSSTIVSAATGGGGMTSKKKTPKKHNRRHTDGGGNGAFSCFSKICGVQCGFVCGGGKDGDGGSVRSKRGGSKHIRRTYSADDLNFV